ncbi:MAG: trigger factor [Ruminococcaceae bacterium]|nr:trigger factor [Oscillospiraceae bacterium]
MSSVLDKKEKNTVEFTMTVAAETFRDAMDKSFRKNVKNITLPGFRKGKAPRKLIEKTYGEAVFYDDAIDIVFPAEYEAAIKELALEPVDMPRLDVKEIGTDKDLVMTVSVTVKPEFELGEYKGIKLEEIVHTVSDADVDRELAQKQERNSRLVTVEDRAVKEGDIANINFEGFVDDVAFPGGKGENYDLTIGSGQFIPGFEEQIVGKAIGEEFDVNVSFPEEYHAEELKGKPAVFKVKVNGIQYKEMPELDDEFAKDVSEFDTLAELKADILAKLTEQAEKTAKQERENAAIDKLVEDTEIDVPDCMITNRVESMIRENNMRMAQQGISFEQYLSYMGSSVDQFKEMMRPNAEKQVKANLILEAIVKKEAFEITDEMVDDKIKEMAEMYHMEADKLKENITDNDKENIKADMQMEKAVALIVDNVKWSKAKAAKSTTKTAAKTAKAADEEAKAEKPAAKKTTTKSTAAKSTAAKSTAKTTTAKSTAKSTTAKSTTKSTTAKSTAAKKPAAKKAEPAAKKSEKKEKAEVEA